MKLAYCALCLGLLFSGFHSIRAQQTAPSSPTPHRETIPVIQATTRAVILDVVVTDHKGKPVSGLTKSDFTLLENGAGQKIASFRAVNLNGGGTQDPEDSPRTVLLIDELNTRFTDLAYARYSLHQFFNKNDGQLSQLTTLLALTNNGLLTLHDYTRDGHALEAALHNHRPALPYMLGQGFYGAMDRISISLEVLQQIAASTEGFHTHKTIVWISPGFPLFSTLVLLPDDQQRLYDTVRKISNQLLRSRITVDTVDPRGVLGATAANNDYFGAYAGGPMDIGDAAIGDLALQSLASQTGGRALYGRNDVDAEVAESLAAANTYYTVLYYPTNRDFNGKFRKIRVEIVDHPELKARTRDGYYALPLPPPPTDQDIANQLDLALMNPLPYSGLRVITDKAAVTKDPDTAKVDLLISSRRLEWSAGEDGSLMNTIDIAAADFDKKGKTIHVMRQRREIAVQPGQGARQKGHLLRVPVDIPLSAVATHLRFVVRDEQTGQIGTAELDGLTKLPVVPGTEPALKERPPRPAYRPN